MNLSNCHLKIHLEFTEVNESCMSVVIQVQDQTSDLSPDAPGFYVFEHDISLPETVNLVFSGKDMNRDTVLDESGAIIKDKCVIIRKITLDGFAVDKFYLQKHLELDNGSDKIRSNYVGHNGSMALVFDRQNVFFQIQHMSEIGKAIDRINSGNQKSFRNKN